MPMTHHLPMLPPLLLLLLFVIAPPVSTTTWIGNPYDHQRILL